MSICSTHSSSPAPDSTVSENGYRLTTTSSKAATPSSSSAARCSALRVSASRPACTIGCRVFTRPSSTSGKPVTSSTGVTGTPAAAMVFAVEPVDTMATPSACRPCASSASPVLSYTLINARRIGRLPFRPLSSRSSRPHAVHPMTALRPVHVTPRVAIAARTSTNSRRSTTLIRSCSEASSSSVEDGHRLLRQDRPGVHPRVDEVHRAARDPHAVGQRVGHRVRAGECGQQRGMGVDDPA